MLERSPSPRRRAPLAAVVRRALSWPARVAQARRTLTLLGRMTDRELIDIGLLRSDLADCAALPLGEDPGHELAQRRAVRAWFAPGRSAGPRALAPGFHDGDKGADLAGAEHGDQSRFEMDYLTNIRLTDQ